MLAKYSSTGHTNHGNVDQVLRTCYAKDMNSEPSKRIPSIIKGCSISSNVIDIATNLIFLIVYKKICDGKITTPHKEWCCSLSFPLSGFLAGFVN